MKIRRAKFIMAGCLLSVAVWGQNSKIVQGASMPASMINKDGIVGENTDLLRHIDNYSFVMEKKALQEQKLARMEIERQEIRKEENREKVLQQAVWKRREQILKVKRLQERKKRVQACLGSQNVNLQRRILERIVEAEAGDQDQKGKILVANVILNRVQSKSFPNSVEGVVFAHRGNRYQFSPISDGNYYRVDVADSTKKAVERALNGENPSQGALYFMERRIADSSNVNWFDRCLTRLFGYGCHEFYK